MRRFLLPVAILVLIFGFWLSPDVQQIAAGVAIFLFGMLMLEDGFKMFSGGSLERMLEHATRSTSRALTFGILSTTLMQSSSLVSVITISFLSAGLVTLVGAIGIIFGANIGTTTGAWLVAGLGLKVNIAAYAMPMLAISIVLVLQSSRYARGIGYALAGLGFLFLGIHYIKIGFDSFSEQIDLTRFALTGFVGLAVYTLIGAVATVIMQSSHATLLLILAGLAAGQISYDNALALAIGANIGTTITAILGSLTSNFQGKRLALAHLVFNTATAAVALVFIVPLRISVDWVSASVGIADTDYALKLAVFHTIFNLLGVALMLPLMARLISFLHRSIPEPVLDRSQPKYLSQAVDEFPPTIEAALRKEVKHLYDNAAELIAHGLNLSRNEVFASRDMEATVRLSRHRYDFDFDERYEQRVKTLHNAIIQFSTRIGPKNLPAPVTDRIYGLREAAGQIVRALKAVKHLRGNMIAHTARPNGAITNLYNGLRVDMGRILAEIHRLDLLEPEDRSSLWLDDETVHVEDAARSTASLVDKMIRADELSASDATSFLNDSGYAYAAMRDLISAARALYIQQDEAVAEIEKLLALDDEDVGAVLDIQSAHKSGVIPSAMHPAPPPRSGA